MRPDNPTQGRVALPATPGAPGTPGEPARRSDWATLQRLLPYLWRYKWRVILALGAVYIGQGVWMMVNS